MNSILDVRNLLKRYGTFIYTGSRIGDIDLMEEEIRALYDAHMIDVKQFQQALLILKREKSRSDKTLNNE